jgi:hypothetical protein
MQQIHSPFGGFGGSSFPGTSSGTDDVRGYGGGAGYTSNVYTGPRGGTYYINGNGNRSYF